MQIPEHIKDALRDKFPLADFTEYFRLLEQCRVPVECALHSHHIAPKKQFPELKRDQENLINLSVGDHYQAHKVLSLCDSEFIAYNFIKGQPTAAMLGNKRCQELGVGVFSPDNRKATSERTKEMWKDPEYRAQQVERSKKRWEDPEQVAAQSERAKELWKDQKYAEICSAAFRAMITDPEIKAANITRTRKRNADPEFQKKAAAGQRTSEARARKSASTKKHWAEPKQRDAHTKGIKKSWEDSERREAQSGRTKEILHIRWHVKRNLVNPNCTLCNQGAITCQSKFSSVDYPALG